MKTIAMIPARLESTRLPRKMLLDLGGKPLLCQSFENIRRMALFDAVYIATDSPEIAVQAKSWGADVVITGANHQSGTERIREAVKSLEADLIVNVQGDEPFIEKKPLQDLLQRMQGDKSLQVATLAYAVHDPQTAGDPNKVKVVFDQRGGSLYFSRALIPYPRDTQMKELMQNMQWYIHIGVYAYSKSFFEQFDHMTKTSLEEMEKLEQNRFLFAGIRPSIVLAEKPTLGIDTMEDLLTAREKMKASQTFVKHLNKDVSE